MEFRGEDQRDTIDSVCSDLLVDVGRASADELTKAIAVCKDLVLQTSPLSTARKQLVRQLIELRQRLQELKEGNVSSPIVSTVNGHQFVNKGNSLPERRFCECCGGLIWTIVQPWHFCRLCGFYVHGKCLDSVKRKCASVMAAELPVYVSQISPEKGLAAQKFLCADCQRPIAIDPASMIRPCYSALLCQYSGLYFCTICHWNDQMVIPARVLHNWDFHKYPVSRRSKQFLRLMQKRPVFRVEALNRSLFDHSEDLRAVKKMRCQLMLMKPYLRSCRQAAKQCLIARLRPYAHFIDTQDAYSVQDLIDISELTAADHLRKVLDVFVRHIKEECEICNGNGYICEFCHDQAVLFPFDDNVARCVRCGWIYHRSCFNRNNGICPRCQRLAGRASEKILFIGEDQFRN
uniref:Phorbol-ester/DAG-type domain-containing protein n=1 Tax=Trichuris muris TaxID=70415 RepID=A0A5S6QZD6_TRIMR